MKSDELMIGDWVLDGTQYAQVTSITCDGNVETTKNEHSNIEVVEPIPLTIEILQKNKFCDKYGVACGVNCPEDEDLLLEISVGRNGCAYWTINWNEYKVLKLQYVHELQHALCLCGIEKEIEL